MRNRAGPARAACASPTTPSRCTTAAACRGRRACRTQPASSWSFATGQESLEVGRSVNVWLARPGAVDLWTYDIVGRETLQTAGLGPIETFHLKPRPIANPRGNITAEMWFAPSLQYLPVRIRVNMGTDTYVDLMVEKIEQR
jgi:hypothetical protein